MAKTTFKDDVIDTSVNPRRKYNMITNSDGTVSFEDVTAYSQIGDDLTALVLNAITSEINDINSKKLAKTDVIDNLTSTATDKALSANQGKVLKAAIPTKVSQLSNDSGFLKKTDKINNASNADYATAAGTAATSVRSTNSEFLVDTINKRPINAGNSTSPVYFVGGTPTSVNLSQMTVGSASYATTADSATHAASANNATDATYASGARTSFYIRDSIQSNTMYNQDIVTNAPNLYVTSNGWIRRTSGSSERFKKDIKDCDPSVYKKLYDVPVKTYKYKDGYLSKEDERYNKDIIGFIAEDINKVLPIAVNHVDGKVEMWESSIIIPCLLGLIQDLNNRLKVLETK